MNRIKDGEKRRKKTIVAVSSFLMNVTLMSYEDIKKEKSDEWIQITNTAVVCLTTAKTPDNNCPGQCVLITCQTQRKLSYTVMRGHMLPTAMYPYV